MSNAPYNPNVERVALASNGGVVYWKTSDTPRDLLVTALSGAGLENLIPSPRAPEAILVSSLKALASRHKTDDVEFIITRTTDPKTFVVHFTQICSATYCTPAGIYTVDDIGVVSVAGYPAQAVPFSQEEIQAQFQFQASVVSGAALGKVLVNVLATLGAVTLRPSGAIYWVPQDGLPQVEYIASVLGQANEKVRVYVLHTVLDAQAITAVRDALVAEVTAASHQVREDLKSNDLGERAIQTRKKNAKALHERVSQYELIFGETLATLHEAIQVAETEIHAAEVLEESADLDGIFSTSGAE